MSTLLDWHRRSVANEHERTLQRPAYYDFRRTLKQAGMTYRVVENRRVIEVFRNGEFLVAYQHRGNWPDALRWFTATFRTRRH